MGLFDRLGGKKNDPGATPSGDPAAARPPEAEKGTGVTARLAAARERLDARDLPGAMAIYEEVLAAAGARPDVLVSLSGELGAHGYARELIELVAPRYDAQKQGPAVGLNLLQAYLATRDLESAQHLLDILFALQRPDLEERLFGFSNVIADLMAALEGESRTAAAPGERKISMITISKPMWFYGLETVAPGLMPAKEGKLRRVAFAQCSLPGLADAEERGTRPEDALGRLSRGIALWLAETFHFSAGYEPVAAVGVASDKQHILFPAEWLAENVRQLHETTTGGIDFGVTSALRNVNDDVEIHLRIWEVKKFRELKSLKFRWTPATADEVLGQLQDQLRAYMEWSALPAGNGLAWEPSATPLAYVQALGASLTLFLGEKDLLEPAQVQVSAADFLPAANNVRGRLALITALQRLKARGAEIDPTALSAAQSWLASDEARALGLSGVRV